MKTRKILEAVFRDPSICDAGGVIAWFGDISLRDYFGASTHVGEMSPGEWFYLYEDQFLGMVDLPCADVVIDTEEAGRVYLWKLED